MDDMGQASGDGATRPAAPAGGAPKGASPTGGGGDQDAAAASAEPTSLFDFLSEDTRGDQDEKAEETISPRVSFGDDGADQGARKSALDVSKLLRGQRVPSRRRLNSAEGGGAPSRRRLSSSELCANGRLDAPSEEEIAVPPLLLSPQQSVDREPGARGEGRATDEELGPEEISELRSLLPALRGLRDAQSLADQSSQQTSPPSAATTTKPSYTPRAIFSSGPNGGGGGGDDGPEIVRLSKDIYSVLFVARPCGRAFVFALGVFAFQILILILILADTIDLSQSNTIQVPGGVSTEVRTAQFLAILVAVATQDDVITSINTLHDGYPGRWMRHRDGAARWQWLLSIFCRFVEGALSLVGTFLLIVQSNAVIDLFLDFLAVTFVSTLDNIAFNLARDGYFSGRLKHEARDVARFHVPKFRSSPSHGRLHCRPGIFFAVSAMLLSGWGVIVHRQNLGEYTACHTLAVQFGDDFSPTMAHFSGLYVMEGSYQIARRAVYVERAPEGAGRHYGRAMIAYCEEEKSWTFGYASSEDESVDPCIWEAKSPETETYDITEIPASEWLVLGAESKSAVPFVHFSLLCNDCNQNTERGLCSDAGQCRNNQCVCDEGRYGRHCEFEEPCASVEVDTSTESFPGDSTQKYDFLLRRDGRKAQAYGRPVYVGHSQNRSGAYHFIVFTGRRWNLLSMGDFGNSTREDLAEFLSTEFHGHWSEYRALYSSAPVDKNTPTDSLTPVGLAWYRTKTFNNAADTNRPLRTLLICARCDDVKNPCSNGGKCVDGTCQCNYGTFGNLCQVSDFVLCRSLAVQFGDDVVSMMGAFSGVYDLLSNHTISGRSVYVERRLGRSMFAYCDDEKAWTFSSLPPGASAANATSLRPCGNWTAVSSTTETYDITTLKKDWLVRRSRDAEEGVPFLYFSLRCNDCNPADARSCGGEAGRCVENRCACKESRYGLNCELYKPCERLELDTSKPGFRGLPSNNYTRLAHDDGTGVKVYERPVYVSEVTGGSFHIIAFIGRRWVVSKSESHALLKRVTITTEVLADYLENSFHGYLSDYKVEYMSEPADVNTLVDTASPVDLSWYATKAFDNKQADPNQPVETLLLCSFCNDIDYVCGNGGRCNKGKCSCRYGTFGAQCQVHSICKRISAKFGPELGPSLARFSGVYGLIFKTFGDRPVYFLGREGGGFGNAMFAYCGVEKSWTFTTWTDKDRPDLQEPCGNWTAKSLTTHTYDVVSLSSWVVRQNVTSGELVPLSFFTMSCLPE